MIRNRLFIYLAILAAIAGVLSRHAGRIEAALGLSGKLVGLLPRPGVLLGIAAVLLLLALIPLGGRQRQGPRLDARRLFRPETLEQIRAHVKLLGAARPPDVPLTVDYTIFQAIAAGASDIHFDPKREGTTLRYRIQGMMTDVAVIPRPLSQPITNRLKVLSNLVVFRGALPQDGRLGQGGDESRKAELRRSGLDKSDFRIAFMPTLHGERIVIRILGHGTDHLGLAELGMDDHEQRTMERLLSQPQGMIVLTGPTGSGKTTTIYAALREIQAQAQSVRSIATLEDPIEYDLDDINQSQVIEEKDFTFDKGLRAVLRQDPDVIMVGEIRDPETARIAIQAGMTGHLLITTVHANSTGAAFSRLLELGVAVYSLNSAISAVIAQRLVRRICPDCRMERGLTEHDRVDLNLATPPADFHVFQGMGCDACAGTGYLGRTAIFEILEVTEELRELVAEGVSADKIQRAAKLAGMRSLHDAGLQAVALGATTPAEIARVINRGDA